MQYEERICTQQGNYIVASGRDFESIVNKAPLIIEGLTVQPYEMTTLYDWFTKPVQYIGMIENKAIFYLGPGNNDLFNKGGFYYDVTYILTTNRILKSYKAGSARDMFLRHKKTKTGWMI